METISLGNPDRLDALIRTAQYLASLTTVQDLWTESGKMLVSFWGADIAGFGERSTTGDIIAHHWTFSDEISNPVKFASEIEKDVAEVLESGLLISRLISASPESVSVAFLPINLENQTTGVLMVGHKISGLLPKEILNIYLGVAGLVGTTAARLASEAEVKKHRQRLEELVKERTHQLTTTNEQLQQEIFQRQETNEFLSSVLESLTHPFYVINPDDYTIELANSAGDIFGRATGSTCHWITYGRDEPCDGLEHPCPLVEIKKTKRPVTVEHAHFGKDGLQRNFEIHAYPVLDRDENLRQVIEYWIDITERKRAEKIAEEQIRFQQILMDAIPNPVFFKDRDGRYLGCNETFSKFLGRSKTEIKGMSVFDLSPKHLADIYHAKDLELLRSGGIQTYEARVRDVYGTEHDVIFYKSTFPDVAGVVGGLIGVILDITERKHTEQALKENEEKFRNLFNNAEVGMFRTRLDGSEILDMNDKFLKIFGWTREEMLSKPSVIHWADPQEREEMVRKLNSDGSVTNFECRMLNNLGQVRICITSSRLYREQGILEGSVMDVTDHRKAEEEREALRNQLFQSQKMESIGTLAGGIAHDFNNLLTIINGYTELVLSETTEDDSSYAELQKVLETGRKGADLVQRLLAFSKKGESNQEPVDLNRVVENSITLINRTFPKIIDIETILAEGLGIVNADAAQVEQVLMNLCINAKEAMPDGGHLKVETRNVTVGGDYCRLHPEGKPGRFVTIEVEDSGKGMAKETKDRMFDPFFTTKGWDFNKGTGLGLSVAKGIVEQHGGWITCQSQPGEGTTFTLYLPVIKDSTVVRQPEPLSDTVSGREKILLVDDEELVRDLGKRILERSGYTVIAAANGKDALEIYATELSNIRLVVLDLIMPQMSGERCLEELIKINPTLRVVVLSGHSLDPEELKRVSNYAKGFVNKPFQMKEFMEVVKGVLSPK